jgi:hypothetical protein
MAVASQSTCQIARDFVSVTIVPAACSRFAYVPGPFRVKRKTLPSSTISISNVFIVFLIGRAIPALALARHRRIRGMTHLQKYSGFAKVGVFMCLRHSIAVFFPSPGFCVATLHKRPFSIQYALIAGPQLRSYLDKSTNPESAARHAAKP